MKQIIFLLTLLMACVMPQNADAQALRRHTTRL